MNILLSEDKAKNNIAESLAVIMAAVKDRPDPETTAEGQEEAKRKHAILLEEARERFAAAGVPDRHAKTIPREEGAWGAAWERLRPRLGRGCIIPITGTRGSGKTQLAVAAVREVCGRGAYAIYTKAMAIFLDIREAMSVKGQSEKEAIKAFTSPRLLVIDAMEVRGETEFENRVLDYIIDLRYDAGLDTILISNQTKQEFTKSLGPSIISRIHESGELIECVWDSFREGGKTEYTPKPFTQNPGNLVMEKLNPADDPERNGNAAAAADILRGMNMGQGK
jgi:DNA replication protein DnaC